MSEEKHTLPQTEEGERAILSCILLDGQTSLAKAIDGKIGEECFYHPIHQKVWRAIQWQHKNNRPLELYALAEELKKAGKLDEVGGLPALAAATSGQPTTAMLEYWIDKVRQYYVLRAVHASCDRMKAKVETYSGQVEDFVGELNGILSTHHAHNKQKTLEQASNEALEVLARIERGELREEDTGYPWPWPDWDNRFGRAKPGELIILSARPGMGKSSVMRQILDYWSIKGNCLLFSREMPVEQIALAMAQTRSGISWKALSRGHAHNDDIADFRAALNYVRGNKKIDVFDRDRTLAHITTRVKAFAQITKPRAVFIDYLQRYDPQQDKGETRDIAIGRFTMAMKDIAIEYGIPVVLLAQIGRGVEKEQREPRMSDLRESGNIEQDADRIVFLNAPEHKPDGTMQQLTDNDLKWVYVDAIQAKGRHDGAGRVGMMFNRPITKFEEYKSEQP